VTDSCVVPDDRNDVSSSLLVGVRQMQPAAWERLVRLYSPLVYTWCRRAQLQPTDAEEVGQEVFLAITRTIKDFRCDRPGDSFQGWVRAIAKSKIMDFFRKRRQGPVAEGGSDGQQRLDEAADPDFLDGDPAALRLEKQLLVHRALELIQCEFETKTWRAFLLVVQDEKSGAETAAELGMTVNAVYLARVRVQRRLRAEFADVFDL
jgi:RNA polymerase sigma-70 factor, ECF subfamily